MTTHRLKIWPEYLTAIEDGTKTFEVRIDDRSYMEGDTLVLCEYNIDAEACTGREVTRSVGWIATVDRDGVECVVMSLLPPARIANDDEPMCEAALGGFGCTRPAGHPAEHVAHGFYGEICEQWSALPVDDASDPAAAVAGSTLPAGADTTLNADQPSDAASPKDAPAVPSWLCAACGAARTLQSCPTCGAA